MLLRYELSDTDGKLPSLQLKTWKKRYVKIMDDPFIQAYAFPRLEKVTKETVQRLCRTLLCHLPKDIDKEALLQFFMLRTSYLFGTGFKSHIYSLCVHVEDLRLGVVPLPPSVRTKSHWAACRVNTTGLRNRVLSCTALSGDNAGMLQTVMLARDLQCELAELLVNKNPRKFSGLTGDGELCDDMLFWSWLSRQGDNVMRLEKIFVSPAFRAANKKLAVKRLEESWA